MSGRLSKGREARYGVPGVGVTGCTVGAAPPLAACAPVVFSA